MNNNNTANDADDPNTFVSITPMYYDNAYNGNGGNRNVLGLTGNTQVIGDNHIGQNTRKKYVLTLTDIMVWMVDNMPEKFVDREAPEKDKHKGLGSSKWDKEEAEEFFERSLQFFSGQNELFCKKKSYRIVGCWLFGV